LLVVAFLTCLLLPLRKVTVGEVRNDIHENLPPGSSKAEIVAFLEARDIGYSDPVPRRDLGEIAGGDIPEDALVMAAIIRDTSYPYRLQTNIKIYFILDESGSLMAFQVEELGDFL